jgi:hypothetical protein
MSDLPRVHCQTYRQLSALKAVLEALGKKLASKAQEPTFVVPHRAPAQDKEG